MAPDLDDLQKACGACTSDLLAILEDRRVPIHLGHKLVKITESEIICETAGGSETLKADAVLFAVGMKERRALADSLRRVIPETEVFVVGDAYKATTLLAATSSAFMAAAYI